MIICTAYPNSTSVQIWSDKEFIIMGCHGRDRMVVII